MYKCLSCNTPISDENTQYCPNCGSPLLGESQNTNTAEEEEEPSGIGGWLIIVIIYLLSSLIRLWVVGIKKCNK